MFSDRAYGNGCAEVGLGGERGNGRREQGSANGTHIFIASSCSFLGMISSMYGASNGYVVTSCVRMARCTEDLTFDFEPGEMLNGFEFACEQRLATTASGGALTPF